MSTHLEARRDVGEMLRDWRTSRGLSQLALALQADLSARHLSFIETGRSTPSKVMILRLCEALEVPLRERNRLLIAAGYAPAYTASALSAPEMASARESIRHVLSSHEPYPAVLVDAHWNLLDANRSIELFLDRIAPRLLEPPVNVLRASLHPDGMAPRIVNLAEWRSHLLTRLRRQIAKTDDPALRDLHAELLQLPGDVGDASEAPGEGDLLMPMRYRHDDRVLSFVTVTAVFGAPRDVTLSEMAIESFYPADAATAAFLEGARPLPLG